MSSASRTTDRLAFTPDSYVDPNSRSSASIEDIGDGTVKLTIIMDRYEARDFIERWTWNPSTITMTSADKHVSVQFPKISEQTRKP